MRLGLAVATTLAALGVSGVARADEPRKVTEPPVLDEPAEITQVVDAFDDQNNDPFDLNLSLGYQQTWKSANIRRETEISQPGLTTGGFVSDALNIGTYSQTISRLNTKAEIGLYKDIALIVRVPIILSNDQKISGVDGSDQHQPTYLAGAPGEQLFQLPFKSPTRSGVEYLAVGLNVGVMNQFRDLTKPTWVIGVEGRFSVSPPMHACNASTSGLNLPGPQKKCAYPSDINRNGIGAEIQPGMTQSLEGNFSGGRSPGVSRGTTGLEAHTYLSKRIKYIEPYGGFKAFFEFQNGNSDYGATDLKGSLVNHPPLRGTMLMGINVIPWEVRDRYQRVTFDFRFAGSYVSEGRDYSELFDALGSSDAPSIRQPTYAAYRSAGGTDSVVDESSQKVYYTGLSDVQQHGSYTLSTQFTWQAGEYVKFNLGGSYTLTQAHMITFDQPCNPKFNNSVGKAGPCRQTDRSGAVTPTGIPNPNYHVTVNMPGRRFKVDGSHAMNAWVNATVMF